MAARLGVNRKTVRKYLAPDDVSPEPPSRRPRGPSTREPYHGVIQQWLAEDARTFYQQRRTAQSILGPKKPLAIMTWVPEDRAALGPLPHTRFDPVRYVTVQTDGYGKFGWDGAHYYSTAPA